jgi:hypothetical protein
MNSSTGNEGNANSTHYNSNNSSFSTTSSAHGTGVTLTFEGLTLVNLPHGPPSSYPLGLSEVMMWSIDMDR